MSWHPNETIRFDLEDSGASMMPVATRSGLQMGAELGRGGMGVVHQATQLSLQRQVAVKTLRPDAPASAKLTLFREAWVTGSLEHPNIVPVHELVVDEAGFPSLVLKRIEGRGWEELLSDPEQLPEIGQSDPFAFHVGVLIQVCSALRFAHAKGDRASRSEARQHHGGGLRRGLPAGLGDRDRPSARS